MHSCVYKASVFVSCLKDWTFVSLPWYQRGMCVRGGGGWLNYVSCPLAVYRKCSNIQPDHLAHLCNTGKSRWPVLMVWWSCQEGLLKKGRVCFQSLKMPCISCRELTTELTRLLQLLLPPLMKQNCDSSKKRWLCCIELLLVSGELECVCECLFLSWEGKKG